MFTRGNLLHLLFVGLGTFVVLPGIAFAGSAKLDVCHIPPGNPDNYHSIAISDKALATHLTHSDLVGSCDEVCAQLCDDGDACTIDDSGDCELLGCPATRDPVDCDDSQACTFDSCDSGSGCVNEPYDLTGSWSGPFDQVIFPLYEIQVEITEGVSTCGATGLIGTSLYPEFSCGGNWYIESAAGNDFTVVETDIFGDCIDSCRYDLTYDPGTDTLSLVGSSAPNCVGGGDPSGWSASLTR
jgi:hypothetical protein